MHMERMESTSYNTSIDRRSLKSVSNVKARVLPIATMPYTPQYGKNQHSIGILTPPLDPPIPTTLERMSGRFQEELTLFPEPTACVLGYPQSKPLESEQHPELGKLSMPDRDPAPNSQMTYTFVNIQTSTGKRDWAAETQIRSHAMKRVQRQRQKHKRLQTISSSSSRTTEMLSSCRAQDLNTCGRHDIRYRSMGSTATHSWTRKTGARLNLPLPEPCSDSQTRVDCRQHCEVLPFQRNGPTGVPIAAPISFIQSRFLSLFQKPKFQMNPRMESLLGYRE